MKAKLDGLSTRYLRALRNHLKQGARDGMKRASGLGRQATAIGLETLDMARIHQQALTTLMPAGGFSGTRDGIMKRAGTFFIEAITPIEQTHRVAMETKVRLSELNRTLRRRTVELAAANRQLKREIVRRQAVEAALRKNQQHHGRLLEQSRHMQEQLRQLSHQLLQAQEEERKQISRELHDQIAQTLTGINVHLATLKSEARANTRGLEKKISRTQRLVEQSVDIVHRFARDLRPTVLDDLGLIPALRSLMKDFSKRSGIHVQCSTYAGVELLNSARRTVLYRVTQSALANVAQHANANRVKVNIRKMRDGVRMDINDDGRGFSVERVLFAKRRQRLGLLGMRERVEMVGGILSVDSVPGKGTTIRVQIPIRNGGRV